MRYLFGFVCLCALGVAPVVGCGQSLGPITEALPCTEQGIRDAIAEGGGPHFFACDGAQTVVTVGEIVIDNDVILDGEGNLTVDGNEDHRVFSVPEGVTAEFRGLSVRRGRASGEVAEDRRGGGIANDGTLTLTNSTVSENSATGDHATGGGIANSGTLTLTHSTVSDNSTDAQGGGIDNTYEGTLTLTHSTVSGNSGPGVENYFGGGVTLINSTVSGNSGSGIYHWGGTTTVTNSTVSGNAASGDRTGIDIYAAADGMVMIAGSLIDDDCWPASVGITSFGHNIESPGNTCGFDQTTDQVNVTEGQLDLGPLADNGGPTMTHALGTGSVAIDQIPEADCLDADGEPLTTDQRGEPRPETGGTMCDVGGFEVQP